MAFAHSLLVATRQCERTTFYRMGEEFTYLSRFATCKENKSIWEKLNLFNQMGSCANQTISFLDLTNFICDRTMSALSEPNMPELLVNISGHRWKHRIKKRGYVSMEHVGT